MSDGELQQEVQQQPAPEAAVSNYDKLMTGKIKLQGELEAQMQRLRDAYVARQSAPLPSANLPFDPAMMKMAAGFLAPTKTGSFGESLGLAAEGYTESVKEQAKEKEARDIRNLQDLEGAFKLTQMQGEMNKQNLMNELSGKMYKVTTDASGKTSYSIDPEAALQYAKISGDPKIMQFATEEIKKSKRNASFEGLFDDKKVVGPDGKEMVTKQLNLDKLKEWAATHDDAVKAMSEFFKMAPQAARYGLFGDATSGKSPLDSVIEEATRRDNKPILELAKNLKENEGLYEPKDIMEKAAGLIKDLALSDSHELEVVRINKKIQQLKADNQNGKNNEEIRDLTNQKLKLTTWKPDTVLMQSEKLDPAVIDFYAQRELAGDTSWRTGYQGPSGRALRDAVMRRVPQMAVARGLSPNDMAANKSYAQGLDKAIVERTKFLGAVGQFTKNFDKQLDLVEKLSTKVGNTGIPVLQRWINAGRKSIAGDPDVTALDAAIRGAAREHQRIVTGVTSNAQLHASAAQTADEMLNTSMSIEQLLGNMAVMREESKNAREAGKEELMELRESRASIGAAPAVAAPPVSKEDVDLVNKYRNKPKG